MSNAREADRVAAQRAAAQRQAEADKQARARHATAQKINELAAEAARLIPLALEARASRNHEGIQQVQRERKTLFGYKKEMIGAYWLCDLTKIYYGDQMPLPVHLGSDGSILPWGSLQQYVGHVRDNEGVGSKRDFSYSPSGPVTISGLIEIVAALKKLAS
jgi:hypothetical protein